MLIDAASLYFRAFYAVPESVTAPDGTPVNAVRGFCDMIARLISDHRPARFVACLDLDWRPAFRVEALPSYKAHRVASTPPARGDTNASVTAPAGLPEQVPDTLEPQIPVIMQVLAAAGLATAGAEGYEADDVIGTLVARERVDPVLVVSGDRDLMQVVRETPTPVRLVYAGRGIAKAEMFGPTEVAAKFGVPVTRAGEAYAEMAMLRGDPSDGLPGVAGIGAKTAASIVSRFDSWADLLSAVIDRTDSRLSPSLRAKLVAAAEYLSVVEPVVRVAVDAPVRLDRDDSVPSAPVDEERLAALAEQWGLGGSIDRLRNGLLAAHG